MKLGFWHDLWWCVPWVRGKSRGKQQTWSAKGAFSMKSAVAVVTCWLLLHFLLCSLRQWGNPGLPAPAIRALPAALPYPLRDAGPVVQIPLCCSSRWFALSVSEGDGGILTTIVPTLIYLVCESKSRIYTVAQIITKAKLRYCFFEY